MRTDPEEYEHAQCGVFERTCLQRAYVIPCRQQMGSFAVLWARRSALVLAASTWCLQWARIAMDGVLRPYLRYGDRGRLQNVSPPSVLFESSHIFLQYTGDTDEKTWTRMLKFEFCDF